MADDIARWLEGLGLGQYVQAFAENYIDFEVLSDLTEADLEKIEVPLGHRKRLLRAISRLQGASSSEDVSAPAESPVTASPEASEIVMQDVPPAG